MSITIPGSCPEDVHCLAYQSIVQPQDRHTVRGVAGGALLFGRGLNPALVLVGGGVGGYIWRR